MTPLLVCLIGMAVVVTSILAFRIHAFLALLGGALSVLLLTPAVDPRFFPDNAPSTLSSVPKLLGSAFGEGCGKVGIIIALAAIIGQCLLESRAAERIVNSIRNAFGEKHAPKAFLTSGFLLGIPVFFDTVFYLLFPLVRAWARETKGSYLLCVLATVAGGSMAHSLVPPTPGPLMVASELNVSLGIMIPFGFVLGLATITVGYGYAVWADRKWPLPLRETELESKLLSSETSSDPLPTPHLLISFLPILVPVLLIIAGTVMTVLLPDSQSPSPFLTLLSNKTIALSIGSILALLLIWHYGAGHGRTSQDVVRDALSAGGIIILITSAGAAFGRAMRDSGITTQLAQSVGSLADNAILAIAFLLTALVRMAQGSATVAMVTAVGIIAPLATSMDLGFHPVYLALAIGCGSKPGPWMNDSGFWVVARMSGMNEKEMLRSFSVQLTLMGIAGFLLVVIAAKALPLV